MSQWRTPSFLLRASAEKVYLIHRRNQLRAAESLQRKLLSLERMSKLSGTVKLRKFLGSEMVEGIKIS